MLGIDYFLLGFVELKIEPTDLSRIATIFLRNGIRAKQKNSSTIIIFFAQKSDAINALSNEKINISITREFRIVGRGENSIFNMPTIAALLITGLTMIFLSNMVWHIEVDGNSNISDASIMLELEECGLEIGSIWNNIDLGRVENLFLSKNNNIGWININRNGMVAYVSVIEADVVEEPDREYIGYSNIVAKEDCVIEYISVKQGTPVVKVGDVVTKGDPLILGISNSGKESAFCYAEGIVTGRVNKIVSTEALREKSHKSVQSATLYSLKIKIFNFSINIFKKYRNLGADCAIIEENSEIVLIGGKKLPIEMIMEYEVLYIDEYYEGTNDELVREAGYKMSNLLQSTLSDVQLNSIKTYGDYTDKGYKMISELIYSCDIMERVEFSID